MKCYLCNHNIFLFEKSIKLFREKDTDEYLNLHYECYIFAKTHTSEEISKKMDEYRS